MAARRKEGHPNVAGPIEQRFIDEIAAGAWFVACADYREFSKFDDELRHQHDHIWRAVAKDGEKPPVWANAMVHGVPLLVDKVNMPAAQFAPALQLLRDAIAACHGDISWRVRVREYLREMKADSGLERYEVRPSVCDCDDYQKRNGHKESCPFGVPRI